MYVSERLSKASAELLRPRVLDYATRVPRVSIVHRALHALRMDVHVLFDGRSSLLRACGIAMIAIGACSVPGWFSTALFVCGAFLFHVTSVYRRFQR
jgi:hypothetical protein